jgi:hypothetical protein
VQALAAVWVKAFAVGVRALIPAGAGRQSWYGGRVQALAEPARMTEPKERQGQPRTQAASPEIVSPGHACA